MSIVQRKINKYNCVNYYKQHCHLSINKLFDTDNKYIIIYDNNEKILKKYKIRL